MKIGHKETLIRILTAGENAGNRFAALAGERPGYLPPPFCPFPTRRWLPGSLCRHRPGKACRTHSRCALTDGRWRFRESRSDDFIPVSALGETMPIQPVTTRNSLPEGHAWRRKRTFTSGGSSVAGYLPLLQ